MDMTQTWLLVGLAGMALGAVAILGTGGRRTQEEERHVILHGIVPIVAAISYFAMFCGQGVMQVSDVDSPGGVRDFYVARYVDWLFTTPLLLLALSGTAMHSGPRRHGLVFGLVAADVLMITTALFFGLSGTPWIKWTWFAISCGAFLAVYYVIWGPLAEENRRETPSVQAAWRRNAAILSVIWFLYPVVLLLDPEGVRWIGAGLTTALIAVLDLAAKVAYGLLAAATSRKLTDETLAGMRRGDASAVRAPSPAQEPLRA